MCQIITDFGHICLNNPKGKSHVTISLEHKLPRSVCGTHVCQWVGSYHGYLLPWLPVTMVTWSLEPFHHLVAQGLDQFFIVVGMSQQLEHDLPGNEKTHRSGMLVLE